MLNTIDNTPVTNTKSNSELMELLDAPLKNIKPNYRRFRNISEGFSFHDALIHKPSTDEKRKEMMRIGDYSVVDKIRTGRFLQPQRSETTMAVSQVCGFKPNSDRDIASQRSFNNSVIHNNSAQKLFSS